MPLGAGDLVFVFIGDLIITAIPGTDNRIIREIGVGIGVGIR